MSMVIREMAVRDYDEVAALWQNSQGVGLSDADSREGVARFLERNPGLSFVAREGEHLVGVVLCGHDGRRGYILKDDDYVSRIETIIRDLVEGRLYLSPQAYEALAQATKEAAERELLTERERAILRLAQRGLPNPQIAQALHISAGTVRNHLSAIYRKLGVHSRYEALDIAEERGLI